MADLLRINSLRVGFSTEQGVSQVLDHVDLTIGRGEVVGLVGESGCGKTTLARSILGILPENAIRSESSEIVFNGVNLLRIDPRQLNSDVRGRSITFIPQDPFGSWNPVFRVGTQVMELMKWKSPLLRDPAHHQGLGGRLPPLLRTYPRRRRQADRALVLEYLRAVQLPQPEEVLRKYPHEFSGGQRQRLMIAMALLPSPELIIADEPTTALDVTIQAQILKLLRQLVKERNISVLFTTHDLGTAHEICDRIMVMYAGQEMEMAPTDSFFHRPSHPYTRNLLESLPNPRGEIQDIPGEIPGLIDPPSGCRYHPRCAYAQTECVEGRPAEIQLAERHFVRCFHPAGTERGPEPGTPRSGSGQPVNRSPARGPGAEKASGGAR